MTGSGAGIVTPEAVVLSFETAGLGSRLPAKIIDLAIQGVTLAAVLIGAAAVGNTAFGLSGVLVGLFVVVFVYPIAFEALWRGRTPGKAAVGLRVVTVEGGQIGLRHALVRGALALIDLWGTAGSVAILTVLFTPRNQRLGDLAAGTLVLRERSAARMPTAVTFGIPPGWEAYAATIDVSGLSPADYQAVRALLVRAPTLPPQVRAQLASDIALPLLPKLRHRPPDGVAAEPFLLCVAARYQERARRVGPAAPPPVQGGFTPGPQADRPPGSPPAPAGPAGDGFVAPG